MWKVYNDNKDDNIDDKHDQSEKLNWTFKENHCIKLQFYYLLGPYICN